MSGALRDSTSGVLAGFYGKLPARGDFVRAGLPRDFTDKWDDWLQSVIAGSRDLMGEAWLPAFLEAPIWRFALSAGLCGAHAACGLFLPSVDKAGRYFPLTFAALHDDGIGAADTVPISTWLDRCEAAGLAALEDDAPPEQILAMLGVPDPPPSTAGSAGSLWWCAGSPRVKANRVALPGMPDSAFFASMLADEPNHGEPTP
jgi:type VI secretion system protein ImpM